MQIITNVMLLQAGISVRALSEIRGEIIVDCPVSKKDEAILEEMGFVRDQEWDVHKYTMRYFLLDGYQLEVIKLPDPEEKIH